MGELNPPGFLAQIAHTPDTLRRAVKALSGDTAGVVGQGHLQVTTTGSTPLAVIVAAGSAFVPGTSRPTEQGFYSVTSDANVVVTLAAAHATLYRRDKIVAKIRDDEEDSGGLNDWVLTSVAGTPASLGSAVVAATPPNCLVLAEVLIPPSAGASAVIAGNISDKRPTAGSGLSSIATAFNDAGVTIPQGSGWYTPPGGEKVELALATGPTALVTVETVLGAIAGANFFAVGVAVSGVSTRPITSPGGGVPSNNHEVGTQYGSNAYPMVGRSILMTNLTPGLNIFTVQFFAYSSSVLTQATSLIVESK